MSSIPTASGQFVPPVDAADPRSLANILPSELAPLVRALPSELLAQDEVTLTTMVAPTDQQKRLKIQFWDEYEASVREGRAMVLSHIIFGVCTREYLAEFTKLSRNVAWLVSPRPSYNVRVAELIDKGLDQVEKIFAMQASEDGKNAVSIANLKLSALRMLDMRKHGGYTQRIEQKSMNINKNIDGNSPIAADLPLGEGSIDALEQQVKELEKKIAQGKNQNGALLNAPDSGVIDLTPRTEDGREKYTSSEV